mgnify:CR=1 FL=1
MVVKVIHNVADKKLSTPYSAKAQRWRIFIVPLHAYSVVEYAFFHAWRALLAAHQLWAVVAQAEGVQLLTEGHRVTRHLI